MSKHISQSFEQRWICFIDFLGWKELLKKEKSVVYITWLLKKFREQLDAMNKSYDQAIQGEVCGQTRNALENKKKVIDSRVTFFSDCAVIPMPFSNNNFENFKVFLEFIQSIQKEFLFIEYDSQKPVLLRGAITLGDIYHIPNSDFHSSDTTNLNVVFGEGFNRAYELEKKYAKFPRVIIDSNILEIENIKKALIESESKNPALVSKDADKFYFVDYATQSHLSATQHPNNGQEYIFSIIEKLRFQLLTIQSNEVSAGVKEKYQWLIEQTKKGSIQKSLK